MSRPQLALAHPADPNDSAASALESALVWRGDRLAARAGQGDVAGMPSGHALLDAQLPGGGWPAGAMVELLQDGPAHFDWQLLAPALGGLLARHDGPLVLVGGPGTRGHTALLEPFGPALTAYGIPAERLLWVRADVLAARLWAAEQALRCAPVAAVLAWLPRVQTAALRRLHMAAQSHGKPFFVFRPGALRAESSPAPLRLLLSGAGTGDEIGVDLFKRRGPPLSAPLRLAARPAQLSMLLEATRARRVRRMDLASASASTSPLSAPRSANPVRVVALPGVALLDVAKVAGVVDSASPARAADVTPRADLPEVAHALDRPAERA